jgi:rubrerythrin
MKSQDDRRPDGPVENLNDAALDGRRRFNAAYARPVEFRNHTLICNACWTHWDKVAPRSRRCPLCGRRADME